MEYQTIVFDKKDGIATLCFNRSEVLNALNFQMSDEIERAIGRIRGDKEIRAVILTGTGRAFCAGGDIKAIFSRVSTANTHERRKLLRKFHCWLEDLINLDRPVIAAVNGLTLGAGMSLAMAADIIIAAESAKFSQSFVGIGLIPDLASSYFLPRLVGLNKAKELIFTGDVLDARAAERLGIVNRVVPDEDLTNAAWELAIRLAKGPTKAIGFAKAMLNKSFETNLFSFLDNEASFFALSSGTEDFIEGAEAFKEKRSPRYQGK